MSLTLEWDRTKAVALKCQKCDLYYVRTIPYPPECPCCGQGRMIRMATGGKSFLETLYEDQSLEAIKRAMRID